MAYKAVAAAKYTCHPGYRFYQPEDRPNPNQNGDQQLLFCINEEWVGTKPKCIEIESFVEESEADENEDFCEVNFLIEHILKSY
jgi:hypothetical protein